MTLVGTVVRAAPKATAEKKRKKKKRVAEGEVLKVVNQLIQMIESRYY